MTVRERDLGWNGIKLNLKGLDRRVVRVGLQAGDMQDGVSLAEIGAFQEFGTSRIPRRPFMSAALEQNLAKLRDTKLRLLDLIYRRKIEVARALDALGQTHQAQIQSKIVVGPWAPNAASTIAGKGSSKPLIDTGRLRQSIRFLVGPK